DNITVYESKNLENYNNNLNLVVYPYVAKLKRDLQQLMLIKLSMNTLEVNSLKTLTQKMIYLLNLLNLLLLLEVLYF
ncbi:MAG: hypothetical protein ACLU7U_04955, partial [Romboutsia timonensis]